MGIISGIVHVLRLNFKQSANALQVPHCLLGATIAFQAGEEFHGIQDEYPFIRYVVREHVGVAIKVDA